MSLGVDTQMGALIAPSYFDFSPGARSGSRGPAKDDLHRGGAP